MGSYLEKSKLTVKKIIQDLNGKDVIFGFVGYRDHLPQNNTFVTTCQNITDEIHILSFISALSASGGGDTQEAVLDGLNDSALKMSWRKVC